MTNQKPRSDKKWSLYPALHADVSRLLQEEDLLFKFHSNDLDESYIHEYDTFVMGQFACRNRGCGAKGWASKKVAITVRMYQGQRYNARVYHQRCKRCKSLSRPKLDNSYAERVSYRIMKWSGIQLDAPFYSRKQGEKPHQSDLCEGCKAGHCTGILGDF